MTLFWRIVFLLAVFANLLFFAWSQGYFGKLEDGREPLRTQQQILPEQLRVELLESAESAEVAATLAMERLTSDEAAAHLPVCRLLGSAEEAEAADVRTGLALATAQRLQQALQDESQSLAASAGADNAQAAIEIQIRLLPLLATLPPRYWVHFPPLPSRAHVDRKMQELRNLGITDAMPMLAEGEDQHAISLGMFSTPEAAEKHLAAMQQRGVRTAVITPRKRTAAPTGKAQLEVRGQALPVQQLLSAVLKKQGLADLPVTDCLPAQAQDADTDSAADPVAP